MAEEARLAATRRSAHAPFYKEARVRVSVLRGKGSGLELMFAGVPFEAAIDELEQRLAERSSFYQGSAATAVFGPELPPARDIVRLQEVLSGSGVRLNVLAGPADLEPLARAAGAGFEARTVGTNELERRRTSRPRRGVQLSESARSLAADFAGARADLVKRREGGPVLRQFTPAAPIAPANAPLSLPLAVVGEERPETLYHVGTVRGGQTLQSLGNLVVVGDVNPGSELVAGGDIVVFGALRGVAHAGAQGDAGARVYALELAATQLRIATSIAVEDAQEKSAQPEVACIKDGRITIVPHHQAQRVSTEESH